MANNEKMVSGLCKLNAQTKKQLESWNIEINYSLEDEDVNKAKGKIQGYLKALVQMGIIDQEEARELGRFYIVELKK